MNSNIDQCIDFYQNLIKPSNFIKSILESYSFEEWLDLAETKDELEHTLKAFEKDEMYEYCIIIKNKIDNWI